MVLTKLFRVNISNPDVSVLSEVCRDVLDGKIVVFPTETVYGLGASIYRSDALRRIFIAKNRPMDNPLIVHISKKEHLYEVAVDVSSNILKLIDVAWPGPLTLILKKSSSVPLEATAGLSTVAVRMPAHPVAEILINCTGPIAAPSANISGRPSPVTSHHILVDMFGRADMIVDAGDTIFGIESTIVDISTEPPRLLRPGAMPIEKIVELLKKNARFILKREPKIGSSGPWSDAHFFIEKGIPTISGFGPDGKNEHSLNEFVNINSIVSL